MMDVHRDGVIDTRRKYRRLHSRVVVMRVDPLALVTALMLADGDVRRIKTIDARTILVINRPR
jgi:hypothetical protein